MGWRVYTWGDSACAVLPNTLRCPHSALPGAVTRNSHPLPGPALYTRAQAHGWLPRPPPPSPRGRLFLWMAVLQPGSTPELGASLRLLRAEGPILSWDPPRRQALDTPTPPGQPQGRKAPALPPNPPTLPPGPSGVERRLKCPINMLIKLLRS